MKKSWYLFFFIVLGFVLLTGCEKSIINSESSQLKVIEAENNFPFVLDDANSHYKTENNIVYYDNAARPDIDAQSFEVINDTFAKDKNSGFVMGMKIEGSHGATFEYIRDYYTKDKDSVFYGGKKIFGADPKTFQLLNTYYSKDKNFGYYDAKKIEGSDGKSFQAINSDRAKDKDNLYQYNDIVTSFEEE